MLVPSKGGIVRLIADREFAQTYAIASVHFGDDIPARALRPEVRAIGGDP